VTDPAEGPEVRPYGAWRSPIEAALLVAGAAGIGAVVVDGDDVWWDESRPSERGRTAVVRWRAGVAEEVTSPGANVRTLVHEYGGGAWWAEGGTLFSVDLDDQRLRRRTPGGDEVLLTPEPPSPRAFRYADGRPTPDGAWYVCVRERHDTDPPPGGGHAEPRNEIVRVATDGSLRVEVLVAGPDFVASPRPSPDGSRLAWVQWDHPNMPWDDTELWVADLADVRGTARLVSGGPVAHQEPTWGPDGTLYVLADVDDLWAVHRVGDEGLEPVLRADGEIGHPAWGFGGASYALRPDGGVAAVVTEDGVDRLEGADGAAPWATSVTALRWHGDRPVVAAAGWDRETVVLRGDEVLRPARDLGLDPALFPEPERLRFRTTGGEHAHALYYRPANPAMAGPEGERPPLLVLAHGGPTGAARTHLDLGIRYWTSRGFAVVDVNYRGSTGFGRAYRQRLEGAWGELDVDDCLAAARHLVDRGDVDGDRLLIRGGSAGGFTVLSALVFHDLFAAGASRYGVADLEILARDTHKFEARYLDRLVGPYPQAREVYRARSPIHHVERLRTPTIVLQGDEDPIVPPNQAELVVEALRTNGVPHAYLLFPGEQHGFRQAPNIVRALEAELAFFLQVLGIEPPPGLPPVEVR
jgi:dipeptidyl aminopeptidase/acylaminoacyl peptidase